MSRSIVASDNTLPAARRRADFADVGQRALNSQGGTPGVVEQLRAERSLAESEGVRIRLAADQEAASANVASSSERIEAGHAPTGHALHIRKESGAPIVCVAEDIAAGGTRWATKVKLRAGGAVDARGHRQAVLLRRQRAEVERLPATGKPLTETKAPTPTEDTQR